MSPSRDVIDYSSSVVVESRTMPGVRFEIAKISLLKRLAIAEDIITHVAKGAFHGAGNSPEDRISHGLSMGRIQAVYVRHGLLRVTGLRIDGQEVDAGNLQEKGPEALCREIALAIEAECGLTADETKN